MMSVTIAGVECIIKTVSSTQITCLTEPYPRSSIKVPVKVTVAGKGLALNVSN